MGLGDIMKQSLAVLASAKALTIAFCLFPLAPAAAADFVFADRETAAEILTRPDAYWTGLSDMEIGVRLQSAEEDSREALAARYRAGAQEFSEAERERLADLVVAEAEELALLDPLLPDTVYFLRVDSRVEGGLPHTRSNAIVLPFDVTGLEEDRLRQLFYHELHHVLSRNIAEHHDALYAFAGFQPCTFVEPDALAPRRLTNPDAPVIAHFAPLNEAGDHGVVPYTYLPEGGYDELTGGRLRDYLNLGLLVVDLEDGVCRPAQAIGGGPVLRDVQEVPRYMAVTGGNTGYVVHPEEIVAENFTLWMTGAEPANRELVARLAAWYTALAEAED